MTRTPRTLIEGGIKRMREQSSRVTDLEVLYFGRWDGDCHTLWRRGGAGLVSAEGPLGPLDLNPWGRRIDGGLCDVDREPGAARLHHDTDRSGQEWTAVSFPDQGDRGTNCTFLVNERLELEDALDLYKTRFPEVFARFDYAIVLQGE